MILLTTLMAWRADLDMPFVPGDAAWVRDDADVLAVADDAFADGQVIAITLDHARDVIDRSAPARLRYVRRGPDGRHVALLDRPAVAETLDLMPHPEGGWFRETWAAPVRFRPHGYPGERASATGIYFLLGPGEESVWHAVRSDEVWLWHRGGPLTLLLGGSGDLPGEPVRTITLGSNVEDGERPQALVPAGMWQAARPAAAEEVLVTCVVSPGFDFADFRTV